MKYIINSTNKDSLAQADAIFVKWNNRVDILDLAHDYNKEIILQVPAGIENLKEDIRQLLLDSNDNLTLCVSTIADGLWAHNSGLNYYFNSYLKTYIELKGALDAEVKYIMLDAPLFHEYNEVKKLLKDKSTEIIFLPTMAKLDVFDNSNGETGSYIRPEDIDLYEGLVYFGDCDKNRETTLLRIYKEDKKWAGKINDVILDLHTTAINRLVVQDFGERRKNCKMSCIKNGHCRLCYTVLSLASKKDKLKEFFNSIEQK